MGYINRMGKNTYQAKVNDYIVGYKETKDAAIELALEHAMEYENSKLYGQHRHDGYIRWYVSKIIKHDRKFEVEDLCQAQPRAVTTDIIYGSVVAFGFIDFVSEYKNVDSNELSSQGRSRT